MITFGNTIGASPNIGVHEFAGTPEPNVLPTVGTGGTTYIPYTSASSGGIVTDEGTASVTARGVCWATTINPTTADSKTTNGSGLGLYTSSITGLNGDQTYYVRAYATSTVGTAYGGQVSFTTLDPPVLPTLNTLPINTITVSTAYSGGNITDDGNDNISARGICWSILANPTTADSKTTDGIGTGVYSSSLAGFNAATTYHVRAYATNSVGTAYGNDLSFATLAGTENYTIRVTYNTMQVVSGIQNVFHSEYVAPAAGSTLLDGLVSVWELDDNGVTAYDSYGDNDGLVTGTTQGVTGVLGTAYTFDGINDGILITAIPTDTSFAFSLWIKPNTPTTEGSLFEETAGTGLALMGSDAGGNNLKLMWYETHQHIMSPALTDAVWSHVIVSVDDGVGTVYVNGASIGTIDHNIAGCNLAELGVRLTHEYYKGIMDAVRFWNRPLTSNEITELYTKELAGIGYSW